MRMKTLKKTTTSSTLETPTTSPTLKTPLHVQRLKNHSEFNKRLKTLPGVHCEGCRAGGDLECGHAAGAATGEGAAGVEAGRGFGVWAGRSVWGRGGVGMVGRGGVQTASLDKLPMGEREGRDYERGKCGSGSLQGANSLDASP